MEFKLRGIGIKLEITTGREGATVVYMKTKMQQPWKNHYHNPMRGMKGKNKLSLIHSFNY